MAYRAHVNVKSVLLIPLWILVAFCNSAAAQPAPAELISNFRVQHGEGRVTLDPTLTRIAHDQAAAMAAKDVLDHGVLGPFSSRVAPSKARRSAENIAYGYESFSKTLGQWVNSSGHRENLLMHGATKIGVASAKSATTGRTYWAMVIAGEYQASRSPLPKPTKSSHGEDNCLLEFAGLCLSTN
jgi:Cysteine-rich secretory protein family